MLACELGHGAPAPDAVTDDVIVELFVFLGRPEPLSQLLLDAAASGARLPSHYLSRGRPGERTTIRSSCICRERPGYIWGSVPGTAHVRERTAREWRGPGEDRSTRSDQVGSKQAVQGERERAVVDWSSRYLRFVGEATGGIKNGAVRSEEDMSERGLLALASVIAQRGAGQRRRRGRGHGKGRGKSRG
jgi:hypothetical protein